MANKTPVVDPIPEDEWDLIVERILYRNCVPFLGAGASVVAGVPSAAVLAERLADKIGYPGVDRKDFLRVFQYCSMVKDKTYPRDFLIEQLKPHTAPGVVHTTIASMPFHYVLTTNFDPLMENAFRDPALGKEPDVKWYERRADKVTHLGDVDDQHPLVYKLHGTIERKANMVVTEDDVVDFLACVTMNNPPLPPKVQALFAEQSVLFIGYGLKDWNVRVLLRALRGQEPATTCFAVQQRPDTPPAAAEWEKTVMHLRRGLLYCYDVDAVWFVSEMKRRYEKRLAEDAARAAANTAASTGAQAFQ